jgi:hypothetical protein
MSFLFSLGTSALDASTEPAVMVGAFECSGTCGGPDGALLWRLEFVLRANEEKP